MTRDSWFKTIEYKINWRSHRERLFLLALGIASIFFIWNHFFFEHVSVSKKQVEIKIQATQSQIQTLSQALQNISHDIQQSPSRGLRVQKEHLEDDIKNIDQEIAKLTAELIRPGEMVTFLKAILSSANDLQIIKIKNTPPEPFLTTQDAITRKRIVTKEKTLKNQKSNEGGASLKSNVNKNTISKEVQSDKENVNTDPEIEAIKKQNDTPQLYMHQLDLTFSGDFFSVVDFLKKVETIKKRIIWDSLSYQVVKYPTAEVTLSVITISDQAEWVEI